jgi:tripartite-type tricarboxylate transporter receptor subunit TctC
MKKLLLTFVLTCFSTIASAWPTQPIKLVIPFGPGGMSDLQARIYQTELEKRVSQPVVVVYKPGGTNAVAVNHILSSDNDNHTFLITSDDFVAGSLNNNLNFHEKFVGVTILSKWPYMVFGNADSSVENFQKQIQQGKNVNIANLGINGGTDLWTANIKSKLKITGVPYKSTPNLLTDVVSGNTDYGIISVISFDQNSGLKIKPIMVSSEQRNTVFKDAPTYQELGFSGVFGQGWHGIVARKDTDPAAIKSFSAMINDINRTNPKIQEFSKAGVSIINLPPRESAKFLQDEIDRFKKYRP